MQAPSQRLGTLDEATDLAEKQEQQQQHRQQARTAAKGRRWGAANPGQLKGAVPEAIKQRCALTLGTWCVDYLTQKGVPAVTAPRGSKTCSMNCNKASGISVARESRSGVQVHRWQRPAFTCSIFLQVGTCSALTGLCACPAGKRQPHNIAVLGHTAPIAAVRRVGDSSQRRQAHACCSAGSASAAQRCRCRTCPLQAGVASTASTRRSASARTHTGSGGLSRSACLPTCPTREQIPTPCPTPDVQHISSGRG